MKKQGILNAPLCGALAELGHFDTMAVCDAGLPIPKDVSRIDLALTAGVPEFIQTVAAISAEVDLERVILAEEIKKDNPSALAKLVALFPGIPMEFVPHAEFKKQTAAAKFIVRTGEVTPYSNIIMVSGVKTLFGSQSKSNQT